MKSVNLYNIVNLYDGLEDNSDVLEMGLQFYTKKKIKSDKVELETLKKLVEELFEVGMQISDFNDFFYSYSIPQISKEFDLLKFSEDNIYNIELKSRMVSEDKIIKQLVRNQYYLSHFEKDIMSFCYIKTSDDVYYLNDKNLQKISIEQLSEFLSGESVDIKKNLDKRFKVSKYLVSPLNNPKKFLKGKYFLTGSQLECKKKILSGLTSNNLAAIEGKAGTGKTLLVYDIALKVSADGRVAIIHVARLCSGHQYLNREVRNVDIYTIREYDDIDYSRYSFLIIDEAHRLREEQLEYISIIASENDIKVIFALDEKQYLSKTEKSLNIKKQIINMCHKNKYMLKGKIRTNKDISTFTKALFEKKHQNNQFDTDYIDIVYCDNSKNAPEIIHEYTKDGYKLLTYTPSLFPKENSKLETMFQSFKSAHSVIGQEFEKVIVYVGSNFYYNEDGKLDSHTKAPNPDHLYPKMLHQNITRCRSRLCVMVIENQELYADIMKFMVKK